MGDTPASGGQFAYQPLSAALSLTSGTTYVIGADVASGGNAFFNGNTLVSASAMGTAVVSNFGARSGNAGEAPTVTDSRDGFVGPNAQFTAVPEPSSFLMIALVGVLGAAFDRVRRLARI